MKLSFVMQSYLGDYPGSRSNPVMKFNRIVQCFLNQTNTNWELVIVSDGCDLTRREYEKHYWYVPNIKFAYVDKDDSTKMYADENNMKYYRGIPREVGRSIATGDWIGYVDSDDFIMDYTVERLLGNFLQIENLSKKRLSNNQPAINIVLNTVQVENIIYAALIKKQEERHGKDFIGISTMETMPFEIDGLNSEWFVSGFVGGNGGMGSVVIWHKKDLEQSWEDVVSNTTSEDVMFVQGAVFNKKNTAIKIKVPYYVRCHHSKLWDY